MTANTIIDYQHSDPILHIKEPFDEVLNDTLLKELPSVIYLGDHLNGIDCNGRNSLLDKLQSVGKKYTVFLSFIPTAQVQSNYPNLEFKYARDDQDDWYLGRLRNYNQHPDLDYKNFLCSFNGSDHASRKMLVAIIKRMGWFNPNYVSKNFSFDEAVLDGHIADYVPNETSLYRKFFIAPDSKEFFDTTNSFGHNRWAHNKNIHNLEYKLTESFLHIVSESMSTSYNPFITEKFLYSVVTRGLFLAWAQPGWHDQLEAHYGFKKYTRLFDYRFDTIENPVKRLVELMSMISKFGNLTPSEWHDLYLLEQDTIEYNYEHYFSGRYLDCLKVDNTKKLV